MRESEQLRAIELQQRWILTFKLFSKTFAALARALIDFDYRLSLKNDYITNILLFWPLLYN
jgi:hypothetical protein